MNINWIKGDTLPTDDGDYYVIIEAQRDFETFKKGAVEVTIDYFYASDNTFYNTSDDETWWKVLYWAKINTPNIPDDVKDRVAFCIGTYVD